MADNVHKYGFKWVGSVDGACYPKPIRRYIASAYHNSCSVGPTNTGISIGDAVDLLADGTIAVTGDLNFSGPFYGVVVGLFGKVDANSKARPCSYLPGGTTYGTEDVASYAMVIPFGRNLWQVDCDATGQPTTLAAWRAIIGTNGELTAAPDVTDANKPKVNHILDISTFTDGAATESFRVIDLALTRENQDLTGGFVKLIVQCNEAFDPMGTTGEAGV